VYEGDYKQGKMEGRGMYRLADGTAEVGRYFAGADVGEGARWSADRKTAYRLRGGKVEEEVSLEEAARIAGALGLAVPPIVAMEEDENTGTEENSRNTSPAREEHEALTALKEPKLGDNMMVTPELVT